MSIFFTNKKTARSISWNEGIDPETEDRLAYLALSSKEKWNYLMTVILASYPLDKEVTFKKRTIKWT